jgi:hypothetical protein
MHGAYGAHSFFLEESAVFDSLKMLGVLCVVEDVFHSFDSDL